ncbi:hypothetical protein F5613_003075 [Macellibacteroides fermentans]|uniref:Uncharacterized protein n=1 Tax=Macellibacteroides fermentans TaxID=879969 RepID=A0A8E2A3U7_9PORP|nr:hypothetical protein [Macellibacteroides fermentans]
MYHQRAYFNVFRQFCKTIRRNQILNLAFKPSFAMYKIESTHEVL